MSLVFDEAWYREIYESGDVKRKLNGILEMQRLILQELKIAKK